MAGVVPLIPKFQFESSAGAPLVLGYVDVYLAGTTTRTNTWSDLAQSTLNANPIELNSRGEATIYLDPALSYKFVVKNAALVEQWTQDNITGATRFLQAGVGGVGRTIEAKLREIEVSVYDYYLAADGSDMLASANRAITYLATVGGGRLVFPWQSTAYQTSDTIIVSSSNITIELNASLTLTKTTATDGSPHQAIRFAGTTNTPIENPGLIAPNRRVTITCNGGNVTGYTHAAGKSHFGVLFQFCKNVRAENVYVYNGLVGGLTFSYCRGGTVDSCDSSHSVYDNGLYVFNNGGADAAFSATDPATWSNITLRDCRGWSCPNHGLGIFGAVGVTYINPKIWDCGNNTGVAIAGPAGGLGIEHDGTNTTRDYRFTAINVDVANSWGYGIRTNCKGTRIIGGQVRNTKKPTAAGYVDSTPPVWGRAIFCQGGATDCEFYVDIDGADRVGLGLAVANGLYPGAKYRGSITGCDDRAVYGVGISFLELDPTCRFYSNGDAANTTAGTFYTVEVNNSADNINGGTFIAGGRFDSNHAGCITTAAVGTVDLTRSISGKDNMVSYATAYHSIYVVSCVDLFAGNIQFVDTISKQARVLKCDAATRATISRASILGNQTNANLPRADVTATTLYADYYIGTASYDPASVAAGTFGATTTVTVTGAVAGDHVKVSCNNANSIIWIGTISAADTATVVPFNPTVGAIDLGTVTLEVTAMRVLG